MGSLFSSFLPCKKTKKQKNITDTDKARTVSLRLWGQASETSSAAAHRIHGNVYGGELVYSHQVQEVLYKLLDPSSNQASLQMYIGKHFYPQHPHRTVQVTNTTYKNDTTDLSRNSNPNRGENECFSESCRRSCCSSEVMVSVSESVFLKPSKSSRSHRFSWIHDTQYTESHIKTRNRFLLDFLKWIK